MGLIFFPIDFEWGNSVDPQMVADLLDKRPDAKAVFSTLCETSTGALHDIKSLGEITKHRSTLLVVDAVSALGADDLQMDSWGVDVVVSCSQKGLMTPPGLAFASAQPIGMGNLRKRNTSQILFRPSEGTAGKLGRFNALYPSDYIHHCFTERLESDNYGRYPKRHHTSCLSR
jgi:aspartate aminotransferase-like enzyme